MQPSLFLPQGSRARTCNNCAQGKHVTVTLYPGDSIKKLVQLQVPLQLPCYDFTPVLDPSLTHISTNCDKKAKLLPTMLSDLENV